VLGGDALVQLGMFDFSVLTGGDDDRKSAASVLSSDDSASGTEPKDDATPLKPTKKDLRKGWQADSEAAFCVYCNEAFTFLRRRHHCRHCGTVVCDHCSQYVYPASPSLLIELVFLISFLADDCSTWRDKSYL
jgi:hypothetical protein